MNSKSIINRIKETLKDNVDDKTKINAQRFLKNKSKFMALKHQYVAK